MIIWFSLASIPVLISIIIAWRVLANFKPYQHFTISAPKLYLLNQPEQFSTSYLLNYPYQPHGANWTIEWLIKGKQPALVMFVASEFIRSANLSAVEIEDYAVQLNSDGTEVIQLQWSDQESHKISDKLITNLFQNLMLNDNEKVGWQLVFNNQQLSESVIKCSLQLMITAPDISRRKQIITQIEDFLSQHSPLYNAHTDITLVDYQKRELASSILHLKKEQFAVLASNKIN